jgi:hypothetical protein
VRGDRVGYVLGLARNKRLHRALGREMAEAQAEHARTGKPARRFRDFRYRPASPGRANGG